MWRDYGVAEIERVVGAAVECFPERAYTKSIIEQWQRTHRVVQVRDDRFGLNELLRALEVPSPCQRPTPTGVMRRSAACLPLRSGLGSRPPPLRPGMTHQVADHPFGRRRWVAEVLRSQACSP